MFVCYEYIKSLLEANLQFLVPKSIWKRLQTMPEQLRTILTKLRTLLKTLKLIPAIFGVMPARLRTVLKNVGKELIAFLANKLYPGKKK